MNLEEASGNSGDGLISVREAAGTALFVAAIAEANRTVPIRFTPRNHSPPPPF